MHSELFKRFALRNSFTDDGVLIPPIPVNRDVTILQYIVIFIAAIQYNTPDKNIDILLIAIYCDILQDIATFIAFKVVSIQLLHHKSLVTMNIQCNFLLFYMFLLSFYC